MRFTKIGANTKETLKSLHLGSFFKKFKMRGKKMTSERWGKPLMILIDIIFIELRSNKMLIFPYLKEY